MKTIQLKQCYRCRRLFHSNDPDVRYCKDCQREVNKRRVFRSSKNFTLLKYGVGFFVGLFVFNLGFPLTKLLGLGIMGYMGYLIWRRYSY